MFDCKLSSGEFEVVCSCGESDEFYDLLIIVVVIVCFVEIKFGVVVLVLVFVGVCFCWVEFGC